MARPFDTTGCIECGASFDRTEAEQAAEGGLACPACGSRTVRGIPKQYVSSTTRATTRCLACGSTFSRGETETEVKGELACPVCGSTTDLEPLDADA